MLQYMAAAGIRKHCPDAEICGLDMPEWGISQRRVDAWPEKALRFGLHHFNLNVSGTGAALASGAIDAIVVDCWAQHMENFPSREECRELFPVPAAFEDVSGYGDDTILCSVRGAEILTGTHEHYTVLPVEFYADVFQRTKLKPVFFGQIGDNLYANELRAAFPSAEFIEGKGTIHDFQTIRNSKNIVVSISTFAWAAAYLSHARLVILPLHGLFNPNQARDHFFIPEHDPTYEYYSFPFAHSIDLYKHPSKFFRNQRFLGSNSKLLGKKQLRAKLEGRLNFRRELSDFLPFFDERFYLDIYEDVRSTIQSGGLKSGMEHYVRHGFEQGRRAFSIDTWFYTHEYGAAACEISDGFFVDHWHHYVEVGHKRGYERHAPPGYWDAQ